jgi:hypothetical protein
MEPVCRDLVKFDVLRGTQFAECLAPQFQPVSTVDEAVEHGIGDGGITKHLVIPPCLTGESLKCGWLIRTILFMAGAFRSAVAARDGDRG